MRHRPAIIPVATVSLAMVVSALPEFALGALGPFIVSEFELTGTSFGMLASIYFLVGSALSVPAGATADALQLRTTLILLFSFGLAALAVMSVAPTYWILAVALILMRWAGPATVQTLQYLGAEIPDYRSLRATAPWKYLGFVAGSTFLIAALASLSKGSFRYSYLLYAFLISILVALFYDVPFRNLLLPPNGDL
jgi:MFS family permease